MNIYRTSLIVAGLALVLGYQMGHAQGGKSAPDAKQIEHGRYVVLIGGCNDCHTTGYGEADGKTPEANRLKGDTLGFRGPWGTTYPTNLRLSIGKMTEDQWMKYAKTLMTRPPMPWFNIRGMTDTDLRDLHAYIQSLGASGTASPAYLPPDKAPKPPFIQWPGVK